MLWKNRLGETAEIEISPEKSDFSKGDFLWRLSSAQIKSANQFSNFEGYDRILFVYQGEGLLLNDFKLEQLQAYKFSGEKVINCDLILGEVIDLGLIYKRDIITADATVKIFASGALPSVIHFAEGLNFLFCVKGSFLLNQIRVEAMDTLKISGPTDHELLLVDPTQTVTCIHFVIKFLSQS